MFYANKHKCYSELSLKELHEETIKYTNVFEPTLFETITIDEYKENVIIYKDNYIVSKEWLAYVFNKNIYK